VAGTVTSAESGIRRPVAAPVLAGAVGIGAAVVFHFVDPVGGPVLCPLRAATGLACPLCGVTRMVHELAVGDLARAFRLNVLAFVLAPFVVWWAFVALTAMLGGPRWRTPTLGRRGSIVLLVIALAFGVLRNLPPFHAFRSV
jgi:hypothetical protein